MKAQLNSDKNSRELNNTENHLPSFYTTGSEPTALQSKPMRQNIVVRNGNVYTPLKTSRLALFFSSRKYVFAMDFSGQQFQTDLNLSEIESLLDPVLFFRANRTTILHFDAIRNYRVIEFGKLSVSLICDEWLGEQVHVSQYRAPKFREWIAGT